MWTTHWNVDLDYTEVDEDGWTYALQFSKFQHYIDRERSHGSAKTTHVVRRRRWLREARSAVDVHQRQSLSVATGEHAIDALQKMMSVKALQPRAKKAKERTPVG